MEKDLTKQPLTEQIYTILRHDITHQILKCGDKLHIGTLKKRFNVSQTPIREALNRLQQEGLVKFVPNVGFSVIKLNEEDFCQLIDLIAVHDSFAIRSSMNSDNVDRLLKDLEFHLNKHIESFGGSNEEEYWYHANQVHEVFYKYANNVWLNKVSIQLQGVMDILFGKYILERENKEEGIKDHKKIYKFAREKDIHKTVKAMECHWKNAKKRIRKCLEHF